jgi:hypothetical protein
VLILYAVFSFDSKTPSPSLYTFVPIIGAGLIIVFSNGRNLVGKLLGSKLLVGIGLISYSSYLWHQPLLAFAKLRSIHTLSTIMLVFLCFLSLALGYVSWKYIETPFRNKSIITKRFVLSMLTLALFLIGVGLIGYYQKGFENRLGPDLLKSLNPNSGRLDRCLEEIDRDKGYTCIIGNVNVSPSIAMIGDSHATRLTKRMDEVLKEMNVSAVVYSGSGCIPLLDVGEKSQYMTNKSCRAFIKNAYNEILSMDLIKKVILVSEWSFYTEGFRGQGNTGLYLLLSDTQSIKISLPENKNVIARGLKRTRQALEKSGKLVYIVKSVPEYREAPNKMLTKLRFFNTDVIPNSSYLISKEKYQSRNFAINEIMSNENLDRWSVIIDPYDLYCQSTFCSFSNKNFESFYEDDNHLSYLGSKILVQKIIDKLNLSRN